MDALTIKLEKSDDFLEPWTAKIQELQGCMTHGKTMQEALSHVKEAVESYWLATEQLYKCWEVD